MHIYYISLSHGSSYIYISIASFVMSSQIRLDDLCVTTPIPHQTTPTAQDF